MVLGGNPAWHRNDGPMLLDDDELRIMASALQPQLRIQVSDAPMVRTFQYFFSARRLVGERVLEIGPGHGDFSRLAAAAGAAMTIMDHDPAVVALAHRRGYEAILADCKSFDWNTMRGRFDGLFIRNSIAAQWFRDTASLEMLVDDICSALKPEGWGWARPWNRYGAATPRDQIETMFSVQRHAFVRNGFTAFEGAPLTEGPELCDHWELFLKNIDPGPAASEQIDLFRLM